MGPGYDPFRVETESSGQRCVKLNSKGQYVEFQSSVNANSMVVRYSLPVKEDAGFCIIDLVDLENSGEPLKTPANSLSIKGNSFA